MRVVGGSVSCFFAYMCPCVMLLWPGYECKAGGLLKWAGFAFSQWGLGTGNLFQVEDLLFKNGGGDGDGDGGVGMRGGGLARR